MIIKEKSIKSYVGLERTLRYILAKNSRNSFTMTRFIKKDRPLQLLLYNTPDDLERQSIITEKRIANFLSEFKKNDRLRIHKRKTGVKFYHSIISFHASDTISSEQLLKTARKFAKERYPNSLVFFCPHFDKEHLHLHGLASAVEYATGKTRYLTRREFSDCKVRMEAWQDKQLGLTHSKIDHVKKKIKPL